MEYMRVISSDPPFIKWHDLFETIISPSFLKQEMYVQFCRETTNENNQFSKWETWIFNTTLDHTNLLSVFLLIRIEIMAAVLSKLSIDSILIKVLCRLVKETKKEIYKMIFKKR